MLIISILLLLALTAIAFEDIRHNKVSVFLYSISLIIALFIGFRSVMFETYVYSSLINFCFIAIQLLFLVLYTFLKKKDWKVFRYIGPGDLIFFVIAGVSFSTLNFIMFQIAGFILVIVLHLFATRLFSYKNNVPLAGYQAAFLGIIIIYDYFSSLFDRFNDDLIFSLILK